MKKLLLLVGILFVTAFAHFEVLYTPSVEVESGNEVRISSFFAHPFDGEPLMNQNLKESFVIHKGQRTNLEWTTVNWSTKSTKGQGADIILGGATFRSGGDYAVFAVSQPYFEESEDLYIQQIMKLLINKGGFETDWKDRVAEGYTEIIPLSNPYAMTKGQIFRAKVVDAEGNPVVGAQVEVRLLNYPVNQAKHTFTGKPRTKDDKRGDNSVITDDNGVFAFVPQVAGYWGFVALFSGNDKEHNGKELEQSAVIWISVEE